MNAPPTIVAPLPSDPRVMALAKSTGLTRREAFGAAAEAWAWLVHHASDGLVVRAAPDALTALVDVAGFGPAMVEAGLVGVVNDGLVLPAELRRLERDERGGRRAPAAEGDADERRKEQNRVAARQYRRRSKLTGSKPAPTGDANNYRSLGRVAGHEVRVYNGPHGCYAILLGATIDGDLFKLTTGDKAWSIDTVRLVDVLPGLVDKWKSKSRGKGFNDSPVMVPSYADLRDDAERLAVKAKLDAEPARHADGADASSRHADASASSAEPSSPSTADGERKSSGDSDFLRHHGAPDRHDDALSSMSVSLTSSSSIEEEDIQGEGSRAVDDHERDHGNAEPEGMAEWTERRQRHRVVAEKFADALGEDLDTIWRLWKFNKPYLRLRLEQAGIDPNTGDRVNAGAPDEPRGARSDIGMTTEPGAGDKPATGAVVARERDEFACSAWELRAGLQQQGITPKVNAPPAEDDAFDHDRTIRANTGAACGPL